MILARDINELVGLRGGCLSIGNFDGVHCGHQRILAELVQRARDLNGPAVAMTFDPHPIQLLAPDRAPPRLTTLERKAELIAACGVDALLVVPATTKLLQLSPEDFFREFVRERLAARGMVEGPNFFFGRDRAGDVTRLRALCVEEDMTLTIVAPVEIAGQTVSSSAIRRAIEAGRIAEAVRMLGQPYEISGLVSPGAARGREIGFPTANLANISTLLPPDGVYAARVPVGTGEFPAAVHLGPNPTFGDEARKLEVHLLGYSGSLYGQILRVRLLDRIRETRTFAGRDELVAQLHQDLERVQQIAGPG